MTYGIIVICTIINIACVLITMWNKHDKADRKTEPTISKMKQIPNCADCTHYGDYEVCKDCDDDYNKFKSYYEPKDEPQTEMPEYAEWKSAYEKMTDCSWK